MTDVLRIPARTTWASVLAYSRVLVRRDEVFVSGTLPAGADGRVVGDDDAYLQAREVLRLMQAALAEAGSSLADVVRLRVYLRDLGDFPAVARAQLEAFEHVRPACTLLQSDLIRPEFKVYMDADARLSRDPRAGS